MQEIDLNDDGPPMPQMACDHKGGGKYYCDLCHPDKTREKRLKLMLRKIGAMIPLDEDKMRRADGNARCIVCGLIYFDHPVCQDGLLHVGCDGTLWKL